ncbi:MAG TPA: pyridoxal-dependent decarboxylase [Chryseosolibacter sp.]|nr:pyridoxal-dependent decarboxylase [Chryseosolibacter sp.]
MDEQLKKDLENRSEILKHTLALAEKYFARQDSLPPGMFVPNIPMDDLPEKGAGALATLDYFEANYAGLISNSAGPRYFGFVTGGSTPAAVAADWLVSTYDQNACGSNDSIAPQIEHQAVNYFKQLFGLSGDYYGSFVTGATMSNFVGLALARQWFGEQYGVDPSTEGLSALAFKVVSGTPHASIIKSLSMLGMGRNALHKIDIQKDREAVDLTRLEEFLTGHAAPVIVVANAGTVNTGDFDDLEAIGDLKKKFPFWLHVDAAFGGFAACSEKYEHLLRGINFADSITVDAHKWLNVPYDAAMQFTRHPALQLKIFQNSAAYLGDPLQSPDFFHYTPESSRRWRALPSWFSLRAYGKLGYREIVDRNCSLARQFGENIRHSEQFFLLSPVRLNIVCFTINQADITFAAIQTFLHAVRDNGNVYFTPTIYKSTPAIRAAISNWQTQPRDIEIAFETIANVWDGLNRTSERTPANIKTF